MHYIYIIEYVLHIIFFMGYNGLYIYIYILAPQGERKIYPWDDHPPNVPGVLGATLIQTCFVWENDDISCRASRNWIQWR